MWAIENNRIPGFVDKNRLIGIKLVTTGWNEYRVGVQALDKHANGDAHKGCMMAWQTSQTKAMTEAYITTQKQSVQHNARKSLELIFDCVRFLGEQGLALRGHSHDDGNFMGLIDLMRFRDSKLDDHMHATVRNDYCSWRSQNEILSILPRDITDRTIQEVKKLDSLRTSALIRV